jgi:hypothetical protein
MNDGKGKNVVRESGTTAKDTINTLSSLYRLSFKIILSADKGRLNLTAII